jgi:patatin-like phospholipase
MSRAGVTRSADPYSPQRRTALVLSGTGTAGAYHAGVLRALQEAGVKLDVVAGRGVGVVGAVFAAVDGAARLWDEKGFWRASPVGRFYSWQPVIRVALWALGVSLALVVIPLAVVALGLAVFPIDFVLKMVGADWGGGLTAWYVGLLQRAFAADALPTWLPRLVVLVLGGAALIAFTVRSRGRRTLSRGAFAWRLAPSPLSADSMIDHCWTMLWGLLRGATPLKEPTRLDLGRRYLEFLRGNLGQPGFRELVLVTHDVDAGRDLVFALVAESSRPSLVRRAVSADAEARQAEVQDLCGVARDYFGDAISAALTVPVATGFHTIFFQPESYWRGEAHRLCDRTASLERLMQELVLLGVEQVVLVTAVPESPGPHNLAPARVDGPGRLGEYVQASEAAVVRDVTAKVREDGPRTYTIRPAHNPIGPFDFQGGFDSRSDRSQSLSELIMRGYEDAYHQFIEPILGASGDHVGRSVVHG